MYCYYYPHNTTAPEPWIRRFNSNSIVILLENRQKLRILAAILDFRGHGVQIRGATVKNLKERVKIPKGTKFHKHMTKMHDY